MVQHGTGDGLYHYYRSWYDDPSIPYASIAAYIRACREGRPIERPTEELARERDRLAEGTRSCSPTRARPFTELLGLSRTVFPYVEEHKFYCDYWFLTRWWNKIREFGALLAEHGYLEDAEDVFHLGRHEVCRRSRSSSSRGPPAGCRSARRTGRRSWAAQGAAGQARGLDAAACPRRTRGRQRPDDGHALGRHASASRSGRRRAEGGRAAGSAAAPGVVEGVARVVIKLDQIGEVRDGEILVCAITSPAWAPIFIASSATVTDIGGVMSHAAIVCREYGLPAVVGTGRATSEIETGQQLRVDGTSGVVTILG